MGFLYVIQENKETYSIIQQMSQTPDDLDFEFLSEKSLSSLNYQQTILYHDFWTDYVPYLRTQGKNPVRNEGYAESNIRPIARRTHQIHEDCWKTYEIVLKVPTEYADVFVQKLNEDEFLNKFGEEYSENGKNKFIQVLEIYYEFHDVDWEPEIRFSNSEPSVSSDPFNKRERDKLLNAALEYRSPPNYKNVSPEERDRWNAHLAEVLGKPKAEVVPADWKKLQRSWKFPCLISTALDAGWRAEMVGRLRVDFVDIENGQIIIPPEYAVKNNEKWTVELSNRSTKMLAKWLKQRAQKRKYDNVNHIWLNRKGNPYNSATLNDLLRNLIEEAGIEENGRKLTWHSIRHSTGMYVYAQKKDLGLVAEILRQKSLDSARKYAHPTPETKQGVVESIQGGELF